MHSIQLEGLILKKYSGFYYVQTPDKKIYECKLRGKIKKHVLTGDKVIITPLQEQKGILENVLERDNELYRPKIANVSIVLIVMAHDKPAPNLVLLDRLLFLVKYNNLIPYIIMNKCDLTMDKKAKEIYDYYSKFNILSTSAINNIGIEQLKEVVKDQIAVLAGPSGAGKSSLLNAIIEGLEVKTQEVSKKIGRGKHTTRHVELYSIKSGGWIADTPGFSVLDMPKIKREQLALYFPDFQKYIDNCKFNNCLHAKEKECGVKQAVERNLISSIRYDNYIAMLEEVIENERCYK
ncbi:Ribosome small subunit biogenesis RbfA-release protein RsgA [Candidatus Syntrophocurvum alkaliphilum]|uniref:Small ribosomal subunit biogenesis GTPase RsgA n=1 Tax=Candidatus Syntrophocurvum alkaliphilum TaxID=2293317 RepID=A0A6I6DGV5_9FIRM|nr:ribosome small subunit-dependent GTPase A [Candidatus Syntrophocurvum alkaliphilum]QGT99610.1 Ribosome small subunit biogenesis RbfA-release protein RsgA [Candidatus Syntrophocurvum alkaliphilum]